MRTLALLICAGLPGFAQLPATKADLMGDPKAIALASADRASALKPKKAKVMVRVAGIHLAAGDRAKAEALFQKAVQTDPLDPEVHQVAGHAWLRYGYKAEAVKAYRGLTGLPPKAGWDPRKNALKRAAVELMEAGMPKEAAELMEVSYKDDPSDKDNILDFATAAAAAGERELAATYFARAISAEPKDEEVWLALGEAYGALIPKAPAAPAQ